MKKMVALLGCLVCGLTPQDNLAKHLAKFEGTWAPAYVEIDGKEVKDDIKNDRLVITGTKYIFTGAKTKIEGKLTIDPLKSPPTIDEENVAGDHKGLKTVGIYEIDDKRLMVCYRIVPEERPNSFSTSEKSGRFLIIYKRVK